MVVNLHSGVLANHPAFGLSIDFARRAGASGLPLFFFLSAFLITTLLVLEKQKTGKVHIGSFYTRRILRIWPLYFAFISIIFVAGLFFIPFYFNSHSLLSYFLLSANWYIIVAGIPPIAINFLWSISVEEQFYLVWPTLVRNLGLRGIRNFCVALGILSIASTAMLAHTRAPGLHLWFNTLVQMIFFAGGGLMALRMGLRRQEKNVWKGLGGVLSGIFFWVVAEAIAGPHTLFASMRPIHAVGFYVFDCMGCAALLWGFLFLPSRWMRPQLVYLGRISYGLYVFQGISLYVGERWLSRPLKGGLWVLGSLAMTMLLAIPSYEFFEKPFLRLKSRFEFIHSRSIAGSAVSPGGAVEISEIRPYDRSSMPSRSTAVRSSPRPARRPDLAAGHVADPAQTHRPPSASPDHPRQS